MDKLTAEDIQAGFVEQFSPKPSWAQFQKQQDGKLVFVGSALEDAPPRRIPIQMTDEQWVEYYQQVLESDDYPLSLMKIHFIEVVIKAFTNNLQDAVIIYDGGFDVTGRIPYTPPQT